MTSPVIHADLSDARNSARGAISVARPSRPLSQKVCSYSTLVLNPIPGLADTHAEALVRAASETLCADGADENSGMSPSTNVG